jgi:hypothetical protein
VFSIPQFIESYESGIGIDLDISGSGVGIKCLAKEDQCQSIVNSRLYGLHVMHTCVGKYMYLTDPKCSSHRI